MDETAYFQHLDVDDRRFVVGLWHEQLDCARIDGRAAFHGCLKVVGIRKKANQFGAVAVALLIGELQAGHRDADGDSVPHGAFGGIVENVHIFIKGVAIDGAAPLDGKANPVGRCPERRAEHGDRAVQAFGIQMFDGIDKIDERNACQRPIFGLLQIFGVA